MPAPISYNDFLANVNGDDLAVMTTFTVGGAINTINVEEADGVFNQCVRLYEAGMVSAVRREYAEQNSVLQQTFQGVITPVGAGYLVRLARERLVLSRDPLPE